MKKLKNNGGFSLIEMLTSIVILVLLVMGIEGGMNAGMRAYSESIFESNSASLSGILNTSLDDVLRYSDKILKNEGSFQDSKGNIISEDAVGFVFSNYEYGVVNAYFYTPVLEDGSSKGTVQLKNLQDTEIREFINTGAYPQLEITNFKIQYMADDRYFDITYRILDKGNENRFRDIHYTVRVLNPET